MATCLVIGADRGIGLSLCRQLAARGDTVVSVCLGQGEAYNGAGIEVIPGIDVTSGDAVATMADALAARSEKDGGGKIDCLIHVAGVLGLDELGKLDFDDVRRQIEINTIGPLRAIEAALPYLAADARVGIVTSRVGSCPTTAPGRCTPTASRKRARTWSPSTCTTICRSAASRWRRCIRAWSRPT